MPKARVIALGSAGAIAVAVACATAMPAATGCSTHQCDVSCVDFGWVPPPGGPFPPCTVNPQPFGDWWRNGDEVVWESGPPQGPWLDFPGNRFYHIAFPPDFPAALAGTFPDAWYAWVSVEQDAQDPTGSNVLAAGELAEFTAVSPTGFTVLNNTCAEYSLRIEVHAHVPPLPVPPDGGDGTPDAVQDSALDSPTD